VKKNLKDKLVNNFVQRFSKDHEEVFCDNSYLPFPYEYPWYTLEELSRFIPKHVRNISLFSSKVDIRKTA
jgi:hypothetical protein